MKRSYQFGIVVILMLLVTDLQAQTSHGLFAKKRKYVYTYVDMHDLIKRFISKSSHPMVSLEGIYSVSSTVTKRKKRLLSSGIKERVIDRKDNYANIAIIRDWSDSEHDFLVLSMNQTNPSQYPIVAELNTLSESRGFLCKHYEPDGKVLTFTFTFDGSSDVLEGVFEEQDGKKTITYSLTYLKTFPKGEVTNDQF